MHKNAANVTSAGGAHMEISPFIATGAPVLHIRFLRKMQHSARHAETFLEGRLSSGRFFFFRFHSTATTVDFDGTAQLLNVAQRIVAENNARQKVKKRKKSNSKKNKTNKELRVKAAIPARPVCLVSSVSR